MSLYTPPALPEVTPLPVLPVGILTDDDAVISMLGTREFLASLREAALTVIVATTVAQALDLGTMPLVLTADCAQHAELLASNKKRKIVGVATSLAGTEEKGVRWVAWPKSADSWISLFALAAVQSHFASTSQMLAMRSACRTDT